MCFRQDTVIDNSSFVLRNTSAHLLYQQCRLSTEYTYRGQKLTMKEIVTGCLPTFTTHLLIMNLLRATCHKFVIHFPSKILQIIYT